MASAEPYDRPRDYIARRIGLGRPVLWSLAARYLPEAPPDRGPRQAPQAPAAGPAPEPRPETVRGLTGVKAVSAANRGSTVDPDDASMRGATWYVEDAQSWMIYRVCTVAGHVTTVLLPPGERFN